MASYFGEFRAAQRSKHKRHLGSVGRSGGFLSRRDARELELVAGIARGGVPYQLCDRAAAELRVRGPLRQGVSESGIGRRLGAAFRP